jgi:hypothetical protein
MPLYGIDNYGEIYEQNSVSDNGRGQKKKIEYVDEGSVFLGEESPKKLKIRKGLQAKEQLKSKLIKKQKAKQALAQKRRDEALKIKKASAQKKRLKSKMIHDEQMYELYSEALSQPQLGMDYSGLYGSPHDGFDCEGVVSLGSYYGNDIELVDSFGGNTMLGNYDEGLGFKIGKPKIRISAPKVKVSAPKIVKDVVKTAGKVTAAAYTLPTQTALKVVKATPLVKDVYKGVDKLTGGTLTSVEKVIDLPGRIAAGKPISKAEIMNAAMVGMKAAAIVASGGSAAAIVSTSAGMLKAGPLGKSPLGSNLLTLAEVGGAAAAIHKAAAEQAAKEGLKRASEKTITQSIKEAVQSKAADMGRSLAAKEVEKKTGVPAYVMLAAYNAKQTEGAISDKAKAFALKIGDQKLKEVGLGDSATQAILSGNAEALGVVIKDAPNMAKSKAQRELDKRTVEVREYASIDGLKKKLEQKVNKAKEEALNIEKLKDKIDATKDKLIQDKLNSTLSSLLKKNEDTNKDLVKESAMFEYEKAKSALKIEAVAQGRYEEEGVNKNTVLMIGGGLLLVGIAYSMMRKKA